MMISAPGRPRPMKNLLVLAALCAAAIADARAYDFQLQLSAGGDSTVTPAGAYGMLVADTAGNGFTELLANPILLKDATSKGQYDLLGADNLIIAIPPDIKIENTLAQPFFDLGATTLSTGSYSGVTWEGGDDLALIWFRSGSSAAGQTFDLYTNPNPGNLNANIGFDTPASGGGVWKIIDVTPDLGGTTAASAFGANQTTIPVPEPSSVAIITFALAAGPLLRRMLQRRS
jgi:hypothetical protein